MASETLPEERTEQPTDRRMEQLRREGSLFQSNDVTQTFVLLAGFLALSYSWNMLFIDMQYVLKKSFRMIEERPSFELNDMTAGFMRLVTLLLPDIFLVTGIVSVIAVLVVMLQTNWNKRAGWIKIRWDFVNPIKGLARIFSIAGVINTIKATLKLLFILPIGFWALSNAVPMMIRLPHMSVSDVLSLTGSSLGSVFWKIMYVLLALAIFDFIYGRFQWFKKNKMTKQEVKDERKSVEGDEQSKRKMIAKGLARVAQKLKQTVPKADVIITNPTHYAIALQYDRKRHSAPIVVAKGTDFIALRIREIAKEHNIPILERKALARALYSSTEVGTEVPRDLFKAVAEVLAFVYRLKNPRARRDTQQER